MKKNSNVVGYGRPPIEHQFRPGRSGNPSGRPKGTRRFTADLLDELAEIVAIDNGDQKRALTKQRAIVSVLVGKALEGDAHAITTIIGACARALGEQHADDEAEAPEDRAILRAVAASPAKNCQQPTRPINQTRTNHEYARRRRNPFELFGVRNQGIRTTASGQGARSPCVRKISRLPS